MGVLWICLPTFVHILHDQKYVDTCSNNSFQNQSLILSWSPHFCCDSHKSISEFGHWCWAIRHGSQSAFQFIPKVFNGVEVRALQASQVHPYRQTISGPCFVHWVIAETVKVLPQNVATKLKHRSSKMSFYSVDFPSLELRGLAWIMKNSPRPLFLLQ
jgi:hypothetical protein